jgi:hypothetical protein
MAWENAPVLRKLAASQLIGKNGAQIWGVDIRGRLYTNYQITPGGKWDGWMTNSWSFGGYPDPVYELCASQQHEGEAQLWVLDFKRQLWTIQQDKQGNWLQWQSSWNKPPGNTVFKKMCAVWQGVTQGARFWAITENGRLTSCAQAMPSGAWGAWSDWPLTPHDLNKNPPVLPAEWIEVSACMQGDGKCVLWDSIPTCNSGPCGRIRRAVNGGHGLVRTGKARRDFATSPQSRRWSKRAVTPSTARVSGV